MRLHKESIYNLSMFLGDAIKLALKRERKRRRTILSYEQLETGFVLTTPTIDIQLWVSNEKNSCDFNVRGEKSEEQLFVETNDRAINACKQHSRHEE